MTTQRNWRAQLAGAILVIIVATAVAGWLFTPYDPLEPSLVDRLSPPDGQHLLGTDAYGRDVLSRLLAAGTISITIALSSVALALLLGGLMGAIAGYIGGWTDRLIGMVIDALMAFPGILLALALAAVLGGGPTGVIVALGLAFAPAAARQLRASILTVKEREFVEAARVLGHSRTKIFFEQVLPNSLTPLIVLSASLVSAALLTESALSFLGIGVEPPSPSWGNMLAESSTQPPGSGASTRVTTGLGSSRQSSDRRRVSTMHRPSSSAIRSHSSLRRAFSSSCPPGSSRCSLQTRVPRLSTAR